MIIQIVLASLFLVRIAWLCWQAASGRGRQSRLGWLQSAGEVVLLMAIARLLLNWSMIPPPLWLVPVLIMAAAAMLVIRRWSDLPWFPTGRRRSISIASAVVGGAAMFGLGGLLLS